MNRLLKLLFTLYVVSRQGTSEPCRKNDEIGLFGRVELCKEKKWCRSGVWATEDGQLTLRGSRLENATFLRMYPNSISNSVRRCSVVGFEKLESIDAENKGLTVVEVDAFWDLPALKSIYLAFNSLKEIRFGLFNRLPIETLDLSWNQIRYVSEDAFKGMTKLISLNISHNNLVHLNLLTTPSLPIQELVLSHNLLDQVNLTTFRNLLVLDLSFNSIKYFNVPKSEGYKKLDLTSNKLTEILLDVKTIDQLRIGLNNLTNVNSLLEEQITIKNITILPNPFVDVDAIKKMLLERNISMDEAILKDKRTSCREDEDCFNCMICKTGFCWQPCGNNACDRYGLECRTKRHTFSCDCPIGQVRYDTELFNPCRAPCFEDSDCPDNYICDRTNACISYSVE